jgi:release factor glutamine methyltransferase
VSIADVGTMTVERVVANVAQRLRGTRVAAPEGTPPGIDPAVREARELIAAVLDVPRSWPSYAAGQELLAAQLLAIEEATERRRRGAPLAYAVRSAPFRHLLLYVDERVLIPRPETEYLIDRLLACGLDAAGAVAVDVGTGSGAIALALASEFDFARVVATDVSNDAIEVARLNVARCSARQDAPRLRATPEFRVGDAMAPLDDLHGSVELLVSNPPYIAFGELPSLPAGVRDWEPPQSLACADDGLAVTRAVVEGGGRLLRGGGTLALETDTQRTQRVARMVRDDGRYDDVRVVHDLTGRERFVFARRRGER